MTTTPHNGESIPAGAEKSFSPLEPLRMSEERFRLAAQAGNMFACEWDAVTDVIVLSGECGHVLGVNEAAQISGLDILCKVHPNDRERLAAALRELTPEKSYVQISFRIIHPDRGVIWVESNSRALFDEKGRLLRIAGMVADITPRK